MKMRHFVVEGYCGANGQENMPCKGTYEIGVHCIGCDLFSSTSVENEIMFVNKYGKTEGIIGFGGKMEPVEIGNIDYCLDVWKDICNKKINEAYDEYMEKMDGVLQG